MAKETCSDKYDQTVANGTENFGHSETFEKEDYLERALGLLIFLIEYPRGKRKQGKKTVERMYQRCLTHFVRGLGVFGRNYYMRFVFYLLLVGHRA
ncbi:hypothetical protein QZH41_018076 [Actinostola sp. cb2023]|nr:hypothetical protein QZH41_018076 [Actinostola sp. cb2023]